VLAELLNISLIFEVSVKKFEFLFDPGLDSQLAMYYVLFTVI
jgi:hypothetical protein